MGTTGNVIYSTNRNVWGQLEGVYVSRRKPNTIVNGLAMNTVGVLGQTVRGPAGPREVGGFTEFLAIYGGRDAGAGGTLMGEIWKAISGRPFPWPMVVSRVTAAAAVKAHYDLVASAVEIVKVEATSVGTWANGATGSGVTAAVETATDADANHFNLVITYGGKTTTYVNLDVHATGVDNLASVIGDSVTNPVVVTKTANGRPTNVTAVNLAGGTDGTIAVSDFTAALPGVANHAKANIVFVAEQAYQPHAKILTYASDTASTGQPTKFFPTCALTYNALAGDEIDDKEAAITTTLGSMNIIWCYNQSNTIDQVTGGLLTSGSHVDMACILSQTDVDINPGEEDAIPILTSVKSVTNEGIEGGDLKLFKAAGIAALEKVAEGFQFKSGVAVDGGEIADARTEAYLTSSVAYNLRHDVKKTMTRTRRIQAPAKVINFLRREQKAEHCVCSDEESSNGKAFDAYWIDDFEERARNEARMYIGCVTMPHFNHLVLETDMGTGTVVVKR